MAERGWQGRRETPGARWACAADPEAAPARALTSGSLSWSAKRDQQDGAGLALAAGVTLVGCTGPQAPPEPHGHALSAPWGPLALHVTADLRLTSGSATRQGGFGRRTPWLGVAAESIKWGHLSLLLLHPWLLGDLRGRRESAGWEVPKDKQQ